MASPRQYKRDGSGKFSGSGSGSAKALAQGAPKDKRKGKKPAATGTLTTQEGLKRFGGRWHSRQFRASKGLR